ncbi:MAG TPA: hypothetical protein VGM32_01900, partial [Rhodopila sp.]
ATGGGGQTCAVLLTLAAGTRPRIAEACGVREDTVRLWLRRRRRRRTEGQHRVGIPAGKERDHQQLGELC